MNATELRDAVVDVLERSSHGLAARVRLEKCDATPLEIVASVEPDQEGGGAPLRVLVTDDGLQIEVGTAGFVEVDLSDPEAILREISAWARAVLYHGLTETDWYAGSRVVAAKVKVGHDGPKASQFSGLLPRLRADRREQRTYPPYASAPP